MKSVGEESANASGALTMRGTTIGTARGVAFFVERRTDKGLRRLVCARTLVAMELCFGDCLGERKRALMGLGMGVADARMIAGDASSVRGYRKWNQCFQESV